LAIFRSAGLRAVWFAERLGPGPGLGLALGAQPGRNRSERVPPSGLSRVAGTAQHSGTSSRRSLAHAHTPCL
jgi:hypothetical protein